MILTLEEIDQVVKEYEKESKALKQEIFRLAWYMRGSMSLEEAFSMDIADRSLIVSIIQENIETSKETGMAII